MNRTATIILLFSFVVLGIYVAPGVNPEYFDQSRQTESAPMENFQQDTESVIFLCEEIEKDDKGSDKEEPESPSPPGIDREWNVVMYG